MNSMLLSELARTSPAPANVVARYVGDDWTIGPILLTDAGTAADLTGSTVAALVYIALQGPPIVLIEGSGVTVATDRTAGRLDEVWVPRAVTAKVPPQDRRDTAYPTRIDIVVTDSRGRERTFLIIPVLPLDRRTDIQPSASS